MRIDKWLWAARFFKTRSLAAHACELGRVTVDGQPVKPAREVRVDLVIEVKTPGGDFEVRVAGLSEIRGPAPAARLLYEETVRSREAREQAAAVRRLMPEIRPAIGGRPSKRDRRALSRLRDSAP
ncbi:MAG: RNA-binding S4 domain-containing protein [Bryobacteraceae bacterium]